MDTKHIYPRPPQPHLKANLNPKAVTPTRIASIKKYGNRIRVYVRQDEEKLESCALLVGMYGKQHGGSSKD